MSALFGFFLRLFICFVAAKFFLHAVGVESGEYLVGLTALLTANVYWLRYLAFRDRQPFQTPESREEQRPAPAAESPPPGPGGDSPEG